MLLKGLKVGDFPPLIRTEMVLVVTHDIMGLISFGEKFKK